MMHAAGCIVCVWSMACEQATHLDVHKLPSNAALAPVHFIKAVVDLFHGKRTFLAPKELRQAWNKVWKRGFQLGLTQHHGYNNTANAPCVSGHGMWMWTDAVPATHAVQRTILSPTGTGGAFTRHYATCIQGSRQRNDSDAFPSVHNASWASNNVPQSSPALAV